MKGIEIAIAWTLIHSLWISFGIWLLVNIVSSLFYQSRNRRVVKISGFLLFSIAMIVILFQEIPGTTIANGSWTIELESMQFESSLNWLDQVKLWVASNGLVISSVWLFGALLGALRFISNRNSLVKYKSSALTCSDHQVQGRMQHIAVNLGIKRKVQLMISSLIDSPMTVGIIKPIIYFPAGLISGFSSKELDTLLLHELAHIKRQDYLVNLFLIGLETLFFFNPIILLMAKELRKEMEYTCDDEVLDTHSQVYYAKTLVKLQEINISNKLALAAKNNKSEFKNRIERMINSNNKTVGPKLGIVMVLFISLLVSSAFVNSTKIHQPNNQDQFQETKQDTIWIKDRAEFQEMIKEHGAVNIKGKVLMLNGKPLNWVIDSNGALEKAKVMMEEVQRELVKDGILNENKQKVTLMFQYSDVLNGKTTLGNHYEKYKGILTKYFPVYDSFATTRVFRYKSEKE